MFLAFFKPPGPLSIENDVSCYYFGEGLSSSCREKFSSCVFIFFLKFFLRVAGTGEGISSESDALCYCFAIVFFFGMMQKIVFGGIFVFFFGGGGGRGMGGTKKKIPPPIKKQKKSPSNRIF